MRLIRYLDDDGHARVGIVDGDEMVDAGTDLFAAREVGGRRPLADVELLAPVPPGGKVICVGLNYRDHAEESGQAVPDQPLLFGKFTSSIIGPGRPIVLPTDLTRQVDYEAELGVVIGRTASRVDERDAAGHVLGYTCVNDVSARDLQFADGQWSRGKGLDTFCPVGPWVVTRDEIADPHDLGIRCRVNGETLQDSTTAQMAYGVEELVAYISRAITLQPGDLIATGTPPGVGFARTPPVFLADGDAVEVEIDRIGTLANPVVQR